MLQVPDGLTADTTHTNVHKVAHVTYLTLGGQLSHAHDMQVLRLYLILPAVLVPYGVMLPFE